jgi:hypothetical protein
MSSSLGFSTFSDMENKEAPKKKRERNKNKTIKKRSSKKVEQFLNSMNNKERFGVRAGSDHRSGAGTRRSIDDDIEDILSDVDDELDKDDKLGEPYVNPNYKPVNKNAGKATTRGNLMASGYNPEVLESFGLLKEGLEQQQKYHTDQDQYYNQYVPTYTGTPNNVPYYSQLANSQNLSGPKDELMQKLNYVVHMLEEQADEKTANVTEELVLYMFLGVFVIFVVDSFARAGKYTR